VHPASEASRASQAICAIFMLGIIAEAHRRKAYKQSLKRSEALSAETGGI
jgi:hypothetical protein